ncbi:MAG TPA: peptidoglycan-binding protein [Solirubrobacteraceae bacterium]|jgi:peptidoglycan hydrolase-like protein with peptidoglycan-binding domain
MSGSPRDLAVLDPWEASLARSRARREKTDVRGNSPVRLGKLLEARDKVGERNSDISNTHVIAGDRGLLDARKRLPSVRNLADSEPWHLSTLRSRTRRRAAELQFVPNSTRARRVSLGTLIAIAAGPAAGLADTGGSSPSAAPTTPEPPTTTKHHIQLQRGSDGRQVSMLQHALGIQVDGKFGPQTEAAVRSFQTRHHLTVNGVVDLSTSAAINDVSKSVVRTPARTPVSKSAPVKPTVSPISRLQAALDVKVDGTYGPETEKAVRRLQASHHLHEDGVVGADTWRALGISEHTTITPPPADEGNVHSGAKHTSSHTSIHTVSHSAPSLSRSEAIRRLQEALHVDADGTFGPETEAAVKRMQAHRGLAVDGVVGPETWSALGINAHTTLHPPHSHKSSSTSSGGGGESSGVISRVIAAADEIATRPYVYGGGHGSFQSVGYDCSGSVSYALHGGGLLSSPEDSSALESYGDPGPGKYITIYANAGHAWMVIDGRRFDTVSQQETGSRWSDSMTSTAGYVVRHPAGF